MTKGTRVCSIDGCLTSALARGWCGKHYDRWRANGDPLVTKIDRDPAPFCSVEECARPVHYRGLCTSHYSKLQATRRAASGIECSLGECDSTVLAKGWCESHYRRWKRYGDPLGMPTPRKPKEKAGCAFEGCINQAQSKGLCQRHRAMQRNGEELRPLIKPIVHRDEQGRKQCPRCQEYKPEAEFNKGSWRPDGLKGECRVCENRRRIRYTHQVTWEEFTVLSDKQGSACHLCGKKAERLYIDHDHRHCAGEKSCGSWSCLRALLCRECNSGIGLMRDNPELLRAAADYIEAHREAVRVGTVLIEDAT